MEPMLGLLMLAALLALYFLPAIVAFRRRGRHAEAIMVLNLLLGWTFVGWVGALVWAMVAPADPPAAPARPIPQRRAAPPAEAHGGLE